MISGYRLRFQRRVTSTAHAREGVAYGLNTMSFDATEMRVYGQDMGSYYKNEKVRPEEG
jgi:hypothetical protein